MDKFIYSLMSVVLVSLFSLSGLATLAMKEKYVRKFSLIFVSFAVGAMFGDVFIHLIPELFEEGNATEITPFFILGGILLFFVLEKFLHWRHCHAGEGKEHIHPIAGANLVGDAFHNFLDGLLIASTFAINPTAGIATTIAVILHEIPQEIGDFGVMIHSGMKVKTALMLNLLSAFAAILGVLIFFMLGEVVQGVEQYLLPITIGGFIYIAGSDLIPELKHNTSIKASFMQFVAIILGLSIMYSLTFLE
jgi:zinc and cadmium transporter